jgi:nitrogen fixation/metabolism regulation signal transduction histidine kinase
VLSAISQSISFAKLQYVVKPIKQVVRVTEAVSTGDLNVEFEKVSNDEIGSLVEAFIRMKLSLVMAIRRYERYRMGNQENLEDGRGRSAVASRGGFGVPSGVGGKPPHGEPALQAGFPP